jgi:hypothetical protein
MRAQIAEPVGQRGKTHLRAAYAKTREDPGDTPYHAVRVSVG